jgi:ABC-type proline/glycine betaine transport system permease subunit
MSATKGIHPDEKYKAGTLGSSMAKIGFGVGLVVLVIASILGYTAEDHYRRFQYGYLTAWAFVYTIAAGALFFVLIHHLTRARWSSVLMRVAENISLTFPAVALLGLGFLLPMLTKNDELYFWDWATTQMKTPEGHEVVSHHLQGKLGWLSPLFFTARFFVYMAIYSAMAIYFSRTSRKQDETGDPKLSDQMRVVSGPGMLIFALTTVMVGFDVLMSLAPEWYSTIYSVNLFGGAMVAFYAFLGLLSRAIQKSGRLTHSVTVEHYHDVGKLTFGFIFFWAYTAFSQFMLIWYGNIPEEVVFYKYRMYGDWQVFSIVLLVAWAIAYVALMSRWTKRILPVFMVMCVFALLHHYLDLYWNVMPNMTWGSIEGHITGPLSGELSQHPYEFAITDVLLLVGMLAMFIGAVGRQMKGNLLPVKDPHLASSLAFENY